MGVYYNFQVNQILNSNKVGLIIQMKIGLVYPQTEYGNDPGAIREFAHAAYPAGGSECAQVARYTLLNVAADIDTAIESNADEVTVSRRIRPNLKAALDYHFDLIDAASDEPVWRGV